MALRFTNIVRITKLVDDLKLGCWLRNKHQPTDDVTGANDCLGVSCECMQNYSNESIRIAIAIMFCTSSDICIV